MLREAVLRHFWAPDPPVTVVADPDRLLAGNGVLTELADRGCRIVSEEDPALLRRRVEQERPWTVDRPLLVLTDGPLAGLPYDLWQVGRHVELRLDTFFPNLALPIVRALAPSQRRRLSEASAPATRLGRQGTTAFVLRHAFGTSVADLRQPAALIAWLNDLHATLDPLPPLLSEHILDALCGDPSYIGWPLSELLTSAETFVRFVREQWRGYLQAETGHVLEEEPVAYVLDFADNRGLQSDLAGLLRTGTLEPVGLDDPARVPAWARAGVLAAAEEGRRRRAEELLTLLRAEVAPSLAGERWEAWQPVARAWAELGTLGLSVAPETEIAALRAELDTMFLTWLRRWYAPLGADKAPIPHHVHHVPETLARDLRQGGAIRVALLVLDGLSLFAWSLIGRVWRARHAAWRFAERLVLAQVPTITAVSRQALVSGLRPAEFAATLTTGAGEERLWRAFWQRQHLPDGACWFARLALDRQEPASPPIHARAICLIDHSIDEIIHGSSLGTAQIAESLGVWLERVSPRLERLIDDLLGAGYTVSVASDHGHVEARGIGVPAEGLAAHTRGKRARLYADADLAEGAHIASEQTILWGDDGLLPEDVWAVLPVGRAAFAPLGDPVVTHGGVTVEEVIVPFVTITRT